MHVIIVRFKDGKKITADGTHFNFLFPDDETFSLVINDVQPTDSGSVTCRATNKHGEVSVKAKLHVQGMAMISYDFLHVDDNILVLAKIFGCRLWESVP